MMKLAIFWAGKRLDADEELKLRRMVAVLRRVEDEETAQNLERFLPENDHRWTPNELETGAHLGPWMLFRANFEAEDH
jgi:hypothetical protein